MIKAGTACLDITPPLGTLIPGYFEERRARTIHDPLYVRTFVVERDGQGAAVALCDLIGVKRKHLDRAKERIAEETGLGPDRVVIACTHTHTGAQTGDDAYTDFLIRRIADSVRLAWERREPAAVGWGSVPVEGLSYNRRFRMRDGSVQTNPGIRNPNAVEPAGPTDPELGVLCLQKREGAPLGVLANYSLHYIGIPDDSDTLSADYFGCFSEALQRLRGERFVAALSHAASADVNNIDVLGGASPRNDRYQHTERVGVKVAAGALWAWNGMAFEEDAEIGAAMEEVQMKRRPPPDESDRQRAREIEGRIAEGQPITMAERGFLWTFGPWKEDLPEEVPTWVQALRIGDFAMVTAPGELFVELGLEIKRRSPFEQTMIIEHANDSVGYLPTQQAFEEGGYEVETSPFATGVGEQIVETALNLLERLKGSSGQPITEGSRERP